MHFMAAEFKFVSVVGDNKIPLHHVSNQLICGYSTTLNLAQGDRRSFIKN